MASIVIKSGGSVLVDHESFFLLSQKIENIARHFDHVYVILSAEKGATNRLIEKVAEATNADPKRLHMALKGETEYPEVDNHEVAGAILQGEIDSTHKLHRYLPHANILTQDDPLFPIVANSSYLNAVVDDEGSYARSGTLGVKGRITLVSGFGGVTKDGKKVTLGRGASDLVAGWIFTLTRADRLVFSKDVPGIYKDFGKDCAKIAGSLDLEEAYRLCEDGVLDRRVLRLFQGSKKEIVVGHFDEIEALALGQGKGTRIIPDDRPLGG